MSRHYVLLYFKLIRFTQEKFNMDKDINREMLEHVIADLKRSPKTLEAIQKYQEKHTVSFLFFRSSLTEYDISNIMVNYCGIGCDTALLSRFAHILQQNRLKNFQIVVNTLDAVMPRPKGYEIAEQTVKLFVNK